MPKRVTVSSNVDTSDEFGDLGLYMARRLLALLVDLLGVSALLATGITFLLARQGGDPHSPATFFAAGVYTLFALFVYRVVCEAYLGTTLGKALFGLAVMPVSGTRVGISRALLRNLFLPFDLILIGFILAVITGRRRRLGDFIAGTEVVNTRARVLAPVIAVLVLGAWTYAEYAYADGLRMAQTLSDSAQRYGPGLVAGQPTPAPGPTPLPERTPVPTEQPITVPTLAPTTAASPTAGAKASASPSAAPSPSESGASAEPVSPSPAPAPTSA